MKLIHIGDLHFGQDGAVQGNAPILNHIANRDDIGDLIVIDTGDTVDNPSADIYRTATSAQRQVADRCRRLFKVPGNHDFDLAGLTDSSGARELWDRHMISLTGERPFYPSMHIIGGIAFILVDTCRPPTGRWERLASQVTATGLVGDDQIEEVAEMVRVAKGRGLPVVLPLHHCPSGGDPMLRLADRRDLGDALEAVGGVDLILSGHLHQKGAWSHVYGARYLLSAPKTRDGGGYRVVTWDGKKFCWEWVGV